MIKRVKKDLKKILSVLGYDITDKFTSDFYSYFYVNSYVFKYYVYSKESNYLFFGANTQNEILERLLKDYDRFYYLEKKFNIEMEKIRPIKMKSIMK